MRNALRYFGLCLTFALPGCSGESVSGRSPAELYDPTGSITADANTSQDKEPSESDKKGLTNNGSPLASIKLKEGLADLPAGARTGWVALGIYSDQTTRILSDLVAWSVSDENKAALANNPPGTVITKSEGTFDLIAKLGDIEGRTEVSVSDAYIVSMTIELAEDRIPVGGNGTYATAEGRFSDNKFYDITPIVTFSSGDTSVADISNDANNKGFLRGKRTGSALITARYSEEFDADQFVTITSRVPWSLHIMGTGNTDPMPGCASREDPPSRPNRKYKDNNKYIDEDVFTGFAVMFYSNCEYERVRNADWQVMSAPGGMNDFGEGSGIANDDLKLNRTGEVVVRARRDGISSDTYTFEVDDLELVRLFLSGQTESLRNSDFDHCRSKPGDPPGMSGAMKVDDPSTGTKSLTAHLVYNNCSVSAYSGSPNLRWQSSADSEARFETGSQPNLVTAISESTPHVWVELASDSSIKSGDFDLDIEKADPPSGGEDD